MAIQLPSKNIIGSLPSIWTGSVYVDLSECWLMQQTVVFNYAFLVPFNTFLSLLKIKKLLSIFYSFLRIPSWIYDWIVSLSIPPPMPSTIAILTVVLMLAICEVKGMINSEKWFFALYHPKPNVIFLQRPKYILLEKIIDNKVTINQQIWIKTLK